MESASRLWRYLEIGFAIIAIAAGFVYLGLTAHAMATTSLSTDEFGSIGTFSSRGPVRVITDYRAPKNHIFFNLLNSFLPARDSLEPLRARALSILAVTLTGALVVFHAARRRQWLEGTAVLAIWILAPETLTLSMEARGYGFLGFFAVLAAIATCEYLRDGRRGWLIALALGTALGVYTIPSFLFFAAPLLLALWISKRNLESFIAGAAAGGLILLLYAPVLPQLVSAFGQYQTGDEAEFSRLASLWKATRLFAFPGSDLSAAVLLVATVLSPLILFRWQPRDRVGPVLVAIAVTIYFAILLALHSPPLRVAAFAFLPATIAGVFAIGATIRRIPAGIVRVGTGVFVALALALALTRGIRGFEFLPTENWSLAGRSIDAAFPRSERVDFERYAKYLRHTLPDARNRAMAYDGAAFAQGRLVVVDAGNKWVDPARFTPVSGSEPLRWTIPGRIRNMTMSFHRPAVDPVPGADAELSDGRATTRVPIPAQGTTLRFTPPPNARNLVILLNEAADDRSLAVQTNVPDHFFAGNALILPLSNHAGKPANISLVPTKNGLALSEAWIVR